jgi:fumarate reductase iron-sulfur subunit
MGDRITLQVARYRPEKESEASFQEYEVPYTKDWVVLDGLNYIKDELDGSLTFRWSCRMAICGSCGMMLNGVPHLGCETFLRDYFPGPLRVEPLTHFPIVRDLAIDQHDFLDKLQSAKPWLMPTQDPGAEPHRQTPRQLEDYYQYSKCINCLLCYAACPQYGLNDRFTGPAVLALLHRYNADSRDGGKAERMPLVNAEDGVWGCTLVGYCSEVCPKAVDPARAVNQNKIESAKDYFLRFLKR